MVGDMVAAAVERMELQKVQAPLSPSYCPIVLRPSHCLRPFPAACLSVEVNALWQQDRPN